MVEKTGRVALGTCGILLLLGLGAFGVWRLAWPRSPAPVQPLPRAQPEASGARVPLADALPHMQQTLLHALHATPQGVMRMNPVIPGLIETSTNMGMLHSADGKTTVSFLSRSSVETRLDELVRMIAGVWNLAGAGLECGTIVSKYPGMDAISIGPALQDEHTPDERVLIPTVEKVSDLLFATLERIPVR